VTVVLGSAGYPVSSSKGDVITGLEEASAVDGVEVTHAGTARSNGDVITAGGRVLNVTGIGPTVAEARRRAYDAAKLIGFSGKQMRTDIAARAVDRAAAA
jgi:phosphoribosylamine--glycine ligase